MREAPNEPRRLQDAIGRMEERGGIAPRERRRRGPRATRLRSRRATSASYSSRSSTRSSSSAARRRLPVERSASPASAPSAPSSSSVQRQRAAVRVGADRIDENRVRRGAASQREATVPSARAARNLSRVEQPHRHAGLGERERTRAAGDPSPDDGDVDLAVEGGDGQRICRLGEPVRRRLHRRGDPRRQLDRHRPRGSRDRPARARSSAAEPVPGRHRIARRSSSAVSAPALSRSSRAPATPPSVTASGFAGSIPKTSSTSSAQVTGVAPSRSSAFVPAESELVISPGTARTSRPSSSAKSAVIRAPLRSRASITTVARQRPAMILLRAGKRHGAGSTPGSYSETTRPVSQIRRASSECAAG